MKHLFLILFLLLVAASVLRALSMGEASSRVPVVYWVTDSNPARQQQVALFHRWLIKRGFVNADGQPIMELRLDTANSEGPKKLIQGVSGVAGDILDVGEGAREMRFFHAIGMLEDVTSDAKRLGFAPDQTYAAMQPEITIDARQYQFPCNVVVPMLIVNTRLFKEYGLEPPPPRWDLETFERAGKAFVAAANSKSGEHRRVHFASDLPRIVIARSLGITTFNETLTACALNDARYVRALKLIHKWTYDDHLLPSAADREATAANYDGSLQRLFFDGHYGMLWMGRYAFVQIRAFDQAAKTGNEAPLELAVVEPPHGGFPNTLATTRAAAIYAGSAHKDLAAHFLSFLASEDYNNQIVDDADSLPPNPLYTRTDRYKHPAGHPEEWGCHEAFAEAADGIAIAADFSPYILPSRAVRIEKEAFEAYMAGLLTAEEAAKRATDRINAEITQNVRDDPRLRAGFEAARKRQPDIDRKRLDDDAVPLEWMENPFHRRQEVARRAQNPRSNESAHSEGEP